MNIRVILLLLIICAAAFAACKKNNNDAPSTNLTTQLNIVNASPDTVNFYLNGTRLNSNSNLYPQVISGYIPVLAFNQNYQVKKGFNPANSTVQQLFNISLNLDTGKNYSLFIAGETQAQAFLTVDSLQSDTSLTTCWVRFVNAATDGIKYDLTVGNTPKFTGKAFSEKSDFTQSDTSSKALVTLYPAGSASSILTGTVTLLAGKSYTIYTNGKANTKGSSALALAIMQNN